MKEKIGKKIVDIRPLKKKVVVYFQDEKIEISHNTYTEFNLYLNKVVSSLDLKKLKDFDHYAKDLNYALGLVSKYAYTKSKLKKKLIAKKIKDANINLIMKYLEERNLLDDLAFAKGYVDSLLYHHKGPNFMKAKLKEFGINDEDIQQAINHISKDELFYELVKYLRALDLKYTRKSCVNKKEKITSSLLRNGYLLCDIKKAFDKVNLMKVNYQDSLTKDYKKFRRIYDNPRKIITALRRKGYSYSKIKDVMEEDYDLS